MFLLVAPAESENTVLFAWSLRTSARASKLSLARNETVAVTSLYFVSLVANAPGAAEWRRDLRVVADRRPGAGTLGGLLTAVLEAPALKPADALAHRPTLDEVERRYIAATLNHVRGNQTEAAKLLGISRKALWEKRKRYGLA